MTDTRTEHPWSTVDDAEPLAEGDAWLLDLVSAVDYLRRGLRPDFTVWDALAEAIRWWNEEQLATDGLKDFADRYEALINTCNSCHRVTGHPQLHMRVPTANRFSGQDFAVQP